MQFKGFQKLTLIDYPGRIASIVWVGGCNFRCLFCYNKDLVLNPEKLPTVTEEDVLATLKERKGWIEGLVITGGEPMMYNDLPVFAKKVKELGLLVKIDTNGANPKMLKQMISSKLVDYVAMDVKAPLDWKKYSKVAGITNRTLFDNVEKSVKLLLNSKINYEFRTTVVPTLHSEEDVLQIASQLKGAKKYVLQQFEPKETLINPKLSSVKPYPAEWFRRIGEKIKNRFTEFDLRI